MVLARSYSRNSGSTSEDSTICQASFTMPRSKMRRLIALFMLGVDIAEEQADGD